MALIIASLNNIKHVSIRTDSKLVVKQVNGTWGVKSERLAQVFPIVKDLMNHLSTFDIEWVNRSSNRMADEASKKAC